MRQNTVKILTALIDDGRQTDNFRSSAYYNQEFQLTVLLKLDIRIIQFYIHCSKLFQNKYPDVPGQNIRCTT